jgi:hypothetical protein
MKKLIMAAMVLMLSACYPVPVRHLKPVPIIVYNSYPCSNLRMEIFDEYGWYYNPCRRLWFPRQYWGREHLYRGEPRFVQPPRPHQPPPIRREEPRPERKPEFRPPDVRNRERQAEPRPEARRPPEPPRRPEVRPQEPQRRPEVVRPPQPKPQPSQERRRPHS